MRLRKAIACMLAVLLLAAVLSGCGKRREEQPAAAGTQATIRVGDDEISYTYQEAALYADSFFPFDAGFTLDGTVRVQQTLVALGHDGGGYRLSVTDFQPGEDNKIRFGETRLFPLAGDYGKFCGMAADDSCVYLLLGDEGQEKQLLGVSLTGEVLSERTVDRLENAGISGIAASREGLVIFGNVLEWLDLRSGEQSSLGLADGDWIWAASACEQGIVLYSGTQGGELLDGTEKSLRPLTGAAFSSSNCQGYAGECLFFDYDGIFTYDFAAEQPIELLHWGESNVPGGAAAYVCRLTGDAFAIQGSASDMLTVVGQAKSAQREPSVVRVAVVKDAYGTESQATARVISMNETYRDYQYVMTEYGPDELNRLIAELSSTNSPDLLLFGRDIDTSSAYFEDLYAYLDADEALSRESFLPGLLPAIETRGELHELWTAAQINTVLIRASDWDPSRAFTTAGCAEIMEERGYRSAFESYMSPDNLLLWVADISTGAYVDKERGTCDFSLEGFGGLLAWCKEMREEQTVDDRRESMLFFENLSSLDRLSYWPQVYDQPMTVAGFPNTPGNGSFYELGELNMAIPANSANKDGAWFFIRNQLTVSTQLSAPGNGVGLPVNYEALQRLARQKLNQPEYEQLLALVAGTTKAINHEDAQISQIILEGGREYLLGSKSLEDTVAVIQSRVGILAAEKYG